MTASQAVDEHYFRGIIRRNIALPLFVGLITIGVFVGLIAYLVSTTSLAEHSERVIGKANQMLRLAVDRESSMRGFLLTGDESFLAQYENGGPLFKAQMDELQGLVADNPMQLEKLKQIAAIQERWNRFAEDLIDARRRMQDVASVVASGRGKMEFDETRKQFDEFLTVELRLRQERTEASRRVTVILVSVFLLFSISVNSLLAWMGRRELLNLAGAYDKALRQQAEQTEVL